MQNANSATKKCKWNTLLPSGAPLEELLPRILLWRWWMECEHLSPASLLENLGDWILTRASECCYSDADLPSFRSAGRLFLACLHVAAPAGLYQWPSALRGTQDLLSASLPHLHSSLLMRPVDVKECFFVCSQKNPWSEMDKFMILPSQCYQQKLVFKSLFMKWILFGVERKPTYCCHDLNPSTRIMSTLRAVITGKLLSKKRKEYGTDDLEEKLGLCNHGRNLNSSRKEDLHH